MKEVIIKISPDGSSVTTEVQGVKGPACEDITKALVGALGEQTDSKRTPDFFLQDCEVVNCNN